MTRYLTQVAFTPQAFAALIKNPSDRAKALQPLYAAVGGKLEAFYFGLGENMAYTITSIPDDINGEAIAMSIMAGGAVTSLKTIATLLTAEEAVEAMKKASTVGYKPPAS